MMKRKLSTLLAALMVTTLVLGGCGGSSSGDTAAEPEETQAAEETAEATPEETEEASDESDETEAANDAAILVVSFGTSFNDSRDITIGAIEEAVADAFPEYEVRRAFTSQIIIDKLADRDDLEIDNVQEALDKAAADGVKTLIVQPTHLMNGLEYNDLKDELAEYEDVFDKVVLGEPLLTTDEDFENVITAITDVTKDAAAEEGTAVVFMGHGTEAESNQVYAKLQEMLKNDGFDNYYVGTVEATPSLDDVVAALNEAGTYKKVVLRPLMVVAGDHANNDMAGDEEDSWKTVLTNAGYEVECDIHGLGEIEGICDIYVAHTQAAIDSLGE